MRPLELTFTGLRSYRGRHYIDFRGHNLVGITGDTGAGKSTILIALNFALYGSCTWEASSPKVLIADGTDGTLLVDLTFEVRGKQWKVTRRLSNKNNQALHRLEALDGSGTVITGRNVTARVQELLGMDQRTFLRSVLLPQGKFEQLLHAVPSERAKMLKGLLGLDVLDDIGRRARDRRDAVRGKIEVLRVRHAALLPDPHDRAKRAAADLHEANEQVGLLEAAQGKLAAIDARRDASKREREQLDRLLRDLEPAQRSDAPSRLQALAALDAALDAQDRGLVDELAPHQKHRQGLLTELGERRPGGSLADQPAQAIAVLGRLRERIDNEADQSNRYTAEEAAVKALAEQANLAVGEAERRNDALNRAKAALPDLVGREDGATQQLRRWRGDLDTVRSITAHVADLRKTRQLRHSEHSTAAELLQQAQADLAAAEEQVTAADRALEHQKRLNSAAHAATGLAAGDACPICTHDLPDGFTPPNAPDLHTAEQAVTAAKAMAKKRKAACTKALADESKVHGLLEKATEDLEATTTQAARTRASLVEQLGAIDLDRDNDEILAVHIAALTEAQRLTKSQQDIVETARDEAATADAAAKSQRGEVERRSTVLKKDLAKLTKLRKAIADLIKEAPVEYRPAEPTVTVVAQLLKKAEADSAHLNEQSRQLADLDDTIERLSQQRTQLATRRINEVTRPVGKCQQELQAIATTCATTGVVLEMPPAPTVDLTADIAGRAQNAADINAYIGQALTLGAARANALQNLSKQLADGAAAIIQQAPASGKTIAEALQEAIGRAAVAGKQHEQAQEQIPAFDDLTRRITTAEPHLHALNDLVTLLGDGKFVKEAVHERQQTLLGTATDLLRSMTLGRFAFGPDFQIYDGHTGILRDVKTLSGGEPFQASLALALAVVEQAASSGGRTESLFLDEGFGTLDQSALGYALDALSTQVDAGRLVVVISHMRAVAQHVPALLRVTKSPSGSSVRWATETELAQLADEAYGDGLHE